MVSATLRCHLARDCLTFGGALGFGQCTPARKLDRAQPGECICGAHVAMDKGRNALSQITPSPKGWGFALQLLIDSLHLIKRSVRRSSSAFMALEGREIPLSGGWALRETSQRQPRAVPYPWDYHWPQPCLGCRMAAADGCTDAEIHPNMVFSARSGRN